ncbi:MAG: [FeFe] hydrogenase, group A, partial [Pygmaiobacter sp.]
MSIHLPVSTRVPVDFGNPSILRDEALCIKCGACRRICHDEIGVGEFYNLASCGDKPICVHCGQCTNVCPVDSLTERPEWGAVQSAIRNPDKIVIVSTSPSVRVALGEEFGLAPGTLVEDKMVAALRALGVDYVLDTTFAADLTIMEEASELVERITKKNRPLPQFTSCCPAWVKFVETFYPERLPNLSTVKSPIGMQGPTIKTYFAKLHGLNPENIVHVALTPCTAKKFEIRRAELCAAARHDQREDVPDTDHVITTRELAAWLRAFDVSFDALEGSAYDPLLGRGSGAGVIFGNTGGVMEAAVRTAYHFVTGEIPPANLLALSPVRGMEGVKSATLRLGDVDVRVAIIHGLSNAKAVLEQMKTGDAPYDFVEVMTCRGGCIGGGGQPKHEGGLTDEIRSARIAG